MFIFLMANFGWSDFEQTSLTMRNDWPAFENMYIAFGRSPSRVRFVNILGASASLEYNVIVLRVRI